MFFLGDSYPEVYFTKREVECLMILLEGKTIVTTAKELDLSPRTVEFYVRNMRMKIGVPTKKALVTCMREIDFAKSLNYKIIDSESVYVAKTDTSI